MDQVLQEKSPIWWGNSVILISDSSKKRKKSKMFIFKIKLEGKIYIKNIIIR